MIPADLTLSGGVTHPRRNKTQGTSTATSRSVSRPLHPRSRRAPRRRPRSFLPVWPPSHRMVGVETGILPPELLNLIVHRFHKSDKRQYFFSCFFFPRLVLDLDLLSQNMFPGGRMGFVSFRWSGDHLPSQLPAAQRKVQPQPP